MEVRPAMRYVVEGPYKHGSLAVSIGRRRDQEARSRARDLSSGVLAHVGGQRMFKVKETNGDANRERKKLAGMMMKEV